MDFCSFFLYVSVGKAFHFLLEKSVEGIVQCQFEDILLERSEITI